MNNKAKTLSEHCGLPPGSFDKYMKEEISQLKERDTRLKIRCFHKWLNKSIKTAEQSQDFHSDPSSKAAAGGQKTAFKNTINYLETHFPEYLEDLLTKPPVAFKVTV